MPRLPRAFPSPRRSPISRAIARRLLVEADGPLHLAQVGVGDAQVAEGGPLAPPVADLARDGQVLLVEADGPLHLAQGGVGEADGPQQSADPIGRHGRPDGLGQEGLQEAAAPRERGHDLAASPRPIPAVRTTDRTLPPGTGDGRPRCRPRCTATSSPGLRSRSPRGGGWPAGARASSPKRRATNWAVAGWIVKWRTRPVVAPQHEQIDLLQQRGAAEPLGGGLGGLGWLAPARPARAPGPIPRAGGAGSCGRACGGRGRRGRDPRSRRTAGRRRASARPAARPARPAWIPLLVDDRPAVGGSGKRHGPWCPPSRPGRSGSGRWRTRPPGGVRPGDRPAGLAPR